MAWVYCLVLALPPKSPVMALPSAIVYCVSADPHSTYRLTITYAQSSLLNPVGVIIKVHMPQHHQTTQ